MADGERIPGERVVGRTRHTELSVDEIADLQHGLSDLMDTFARRYWVMTFAARGGNWDLARYEWRESVKVLHQMAKTRPKYAEDLGAFERDRFDAIGKALESGDLPAFEAAIQAGIDSSDSYHEKWSKPYIRFRMPARRPDFLDASGSK